MATKLLLVKDVEVLGRSGEIVNVKPGYARNYLLPKGLGVIANKQTLRQQERLKQERLKKALEDKQASEEIAAHLEGITLTTVVKVDPEGRMYGSVTANEIISLIQEQYQIELEKKNIQIKQPIKSIGTHSISVKLKENISTSFHLQVLSEGEYRAQTEKQSIVE